MTNTLASKIIPFQSGYKNLREHYDCSQTSPISSAGKSPFRHKMTLIHPKSSLETCIPLKVVMNTIQIFFVFIRESRAM